MLGLRHTAIGKFSDFARDGGSYPAGLPYFITTTCASRPPDFERESRHTRRPGREYRKPGIGRHLLIVRLQPPA